MCSAKCQLRPTRSIWRVTASRFWRRTNARCCDCAPAGLRRPVLQARIEDEAATMSKAKVKARRAGFVAIIGRPNAGKSTLLNRFVGQKVAIVTAKPQTTRNRIQGMVTNREGQIVFIDTPGLHEADTVLNRRMMREGAAALEAMAWLLLLIDASRTVPHSDSLLVEKAKRFGGK